MAVTRSKTSTISQRAAKHAYATRHTTGRRAKPSTKQASREETAIAGEQEGEPGPIFHPFPRLPAELQCLVWRYAGWNCFKRYSTASFIVRGHLVKNTDRRNHRWCLNNKRWLALLLTCRTSYDAVVNVDRGRRDTGRKREQYWSRKWIANKDGFLPEDDKGRKMWAMGRS